MAITPTVVSSPQQIVQWIRIGGAVLVVAIALCLVGLSGVGSWLAVIGVALMTWNLHRLGRTGAS